MRCLVDTKVPNAMKYYTKYLQEPSPLGDISIGPKQLSGIEIDLKTVLAEMKTLGKDGELLVVTHSDKDGLMMPLLKGRKVSATFKVMGKILEIMDAIRQRKAIAALPASTTSPQKALAWLKWLNTFERDIDVKAGFEVGNPDWERTVERWYADWLARQHTTTLMLPTAKDLDDLLKLIEDVQKAGFARLEIRACQIGSKSDDLKQVATFLKCKKVVAPKEVLTFYGATARVTVMKQGKIDAEIKENPNVRTFPGMKLIVVEDVHGFTALTPDKADGKKFIRSFIKKGYEGPDEPFITGGVQPVGDTVVANKRYIFPLEKEYKDLLTTVSL